ncbi:GHMP family kinase ATP-binding protein [Kytococcus sp. Marseille-QA3725]
MEDTRQRAVRRGHGWSPAHHGELLQGVVPRASGVVPVLVTFPHPDLGSRAVFEPVPDEALRVRATGRGAGEQHPRAVATVHRVLAELGRTGTGGLLQLDSSAPRRRGLGSSTADVLATARAVADAFEAVLPAGLLARVAVEVEGASDPLMWDGPVLFAHRSGQLLERYPALPAGRVVGLDLAPASPGVETADRALPRYSQREITEFGRLVQDLGHALHNGDLALVAEVATRSARVHARHHPDPVLHRVLDEHTRWGGLGVQVAHSGTVAGVLLPPPPADGGPDPADHVADWLRQLTGSPTWTVPLGGVPRITP